MPNRIKICVLSLKFSGRSPVGEDGYCVIYDDIFLGIGRSGNLSWRTHGKYTVDKQTSHLLNISALLLLNTKPELPIMKELNTVQHK